MSAIAQADYTSNAFQELDTSGTAKALKFPNRDSVQFESDGSISEENIETCNEYGFCVFEKAISEGELAEWRREVDNLFVIAPFLDRNSLLDHQGKLALAPHLVINPWAMTKLLSYSVKGTSQDNGRCPVKVHEPEPLKVVLYPFRILFLVVCTCCLVFVYIWTPRVDVSRSSY